MSLNPAWFCVCCGTTGFLRQLSPAANGMMSVQCTRCNSNYALGSVIHRGIVTQARPEPVVPTRALDFSVPGEESPVVAAPALPAVAQPGYPAAAPTAFSLGWRACMCRNCNAQLLLAPADEVVPVHATGGAAWGPTCVGSGTSLRGHVGVVDVAPAPTGTWVTGEGLTPSGPPGAPDVRCRECGALLEIDSTDTIIPMHTRAGAVTNVTCILSGTALLGTFGSGPGLTPTGPATVIGRAVSSDTVYMPGANPADQAEFDERGRLIDVSNQAECDERGRVISDICPSCEERVMLTSAGRFVWHQGPANHGSRRYCSNSHGVSPAHRANVRARRRAAVEASIAAGELVRAGEGETVTDEASSEAPRLASLACRVCGRVVEVTSSDNRLVFAAHLPADDAPETCAGSFQTFQAVVSARDTSVGVDGADSLITPPASMYATCYGCSRDVRIIASQRGYIFTEHTMDESGIGPICGVSFRPLTGALESRQDVLAPTVPCPRCQRMVAFFMRLQGLVYSNHRGSNGERCEGSYVAVPVSPPVVSAGQTTVTAATTANGNLNVYTDGSNPAGSGFIRGSRLPGRPARALESAESEFLNNVLGEPHTPSRQGHGDPVGATGIPGPPGNLTNREAFRRRQVAPGPRPRPRPDRQDETHVVTWHGDYMRAERARAALIAYYAEGDRTNADAIVLVGDAATQSLLAHEGDENEEGDLHDDHPDFVRTAHCVWDSAVVMTSDDIIRAGRYEYR